ncbi:MAG: hypothetical protein H0W96_13935 [Solirubrobacterales bacterium]|nr:hypothetical protein [Solirubrobacterales bacterium]
MSFQRGIDGSEPLRAQPIPEHAGMHEERKGSRARRLGTGTLACPRCDAPVSLGGRAVSPTDVLDCPFCRHTAAVRDFLSLATPTRPARVQVRVVAGARRRALR